MLPPKPRLPAEQQQLLDLFRKLSPQDQQSLVSFAQFLSTRAVPAQAGEAVPLATPKDIPRPESESVVAAIRRLSDSFHMLERDALFHETAALMTAHVMQGKPATEVIDELEVLFLRHYEQVARGSR
ncbi:MAG: hypothetical protein KDI82_16835 [Gammaproteobacteria bacterium]|nr:hypothetical protein [Gammaproteobacteria bacterium]